MENIFTALSTIMILLAFVGTQFALYLRKQGKHHH